MARLWIDVHLPSTDDKAGDGPITTATEWSFNPTLDEAGSFSFAMPATDPRAGLLQNKRVVRAWMEDGGNIVEVGAGIIDKVAYDVSDPSMLRVSGPDLLMELAGRSIARLTVCEQDLVYLTLNVDTGHWRGSVRRIANLYGTIYDEDLPEAHDGETGFGGETVRFWNQDDPNIEYVYVGCDARFDFIRVTLAPYPDINERESALRAQYFNGSGWIDLPGLVDGTSGQNFALEWCTMAQSGDITFTRPDDWTRVQPTVQAGSWFWVRLTAFVGEETDPFVLREAAVWADVPTRDGVNQIMAHAPATWTTSGYPLTASAKYLELSGESVLAALRALVEQGGQSGGVPVREHFRLGTGRSLAWLSAFSSSGLRAVSANGILAEGLDELCLIRRLKYTQDTAETVTRLYPQSNDGITLHLTTRAAPAGYSLNKTDGYLQNDTGATAYGRIEAAPRYTDIASQQPDSWYEHPSMVANAVFDRALEYLRTHGTAQAFYDIDVAKVRASLLPGHTIRVVYHEYRDGVRSVDIDGDLYVLSTRVQVDRNGLHTVGLQVATVDRLPQSDVGVLRGAIQDVRRGVGSGAETRILLGPGGGGAGGVSFPGTISFTTINTDSGSEHFHALDIASHTTNQAAHHSPVSAGPGISVIGQQVGVGLAVNSGLQLTGTPQKLTLRAPTGSLSSFSINLVSDAAGHSHAIDAVANAQASGDWGKLLKAGAAGGLALTSLALSLDLNVGGGALLAKSNVRIIDHSHDYDHAHMVINPRVGWTLDEQFGLDIDDNLLVRGWIVGKHAIQLDGAVMLAHFDGPQPFETDYTGTAHGHMGQVPTVTGGVIYRPGKFGKAVQVAEATTNKVLNPQAGVDTSNTNVSNVTRTRVTTDAYVGAACFQLANTAGDAWMMWSTDSHANSTTYSVQMRVKGTPGSRVTLRLYDGVAERNVGAGGTNIVMDGTWKWLYGTATSAASGVTQIRPMFRFVDAGTFLVDAVQCEQLGYPTPYCDGSLGTDHSWSGTAHASTSTRSAAHLTYPSQGAIRFDQGTVMAWVRPANNAGTRHAVCAFGGGSQHLIMRVAAGGGVQAYWGTTARSGGSAPVGEWTHIAMVRTADEQLTLYVNGAQVASGSSGTFGTAATLFVGRASWAVTNWFNGLIDDLVILDRAANADEVRAVYESNAPVFAETSAWHWRAGKGLVWADAEGLWVVDTAGVPAMGVSGVSKSWGGVNMGPGDVMIGSATLGHYLHWDRNQGKLVVRGDVAITGTVSVAWQDVTNKPDGAGRLGTGTPAAAGLWLTGSRMGYYNGAAWTAYFDNTGLFQFGVDGGANLRWDGTKLMGRQGSTVQWQTDTTTGAITAGGTTLDASGVTLSDYSPDEKPVQGRIKWGQYSYIASWFKVSPSDESLMEFVLRDASAASMVFQVGDVTAAAFFKTANVLYLPTTVRGSLALGDSLDSAPAYLMSQRNISGAAATEGLRVQTTGASGAKFSRLILARDTMTLYGKHGGNAVRIDDGSVGANIGYAPGAGDIVAGRYLRTDGNRVYFDGSHYLYRSGNDIYWYNGTTGVKLN